jgi:hypothetical protein
MKYQPLDNTGIMVSEVGQFIDPEGNVCGVVPPLS